MRKAVKTDLNAEDNLPGLKIGGLAKSLGAMRNVIKMSGIVTAVQGAVVQARIPSVAIGDLCEITTRNDSVIPAQVIAFREDTVTLAPFDSTDGISPGAHVQTTGAVPSIPVSNSMIGQVVDALGKPLNFDTHVLSSPATLRGSGRSLSSAAPNPLARKDIDQVFLTGVTAIDCLCTLGRGQRVGLFAGAGVGKSTLLGMIARNADVDVTVIGLIGERGREVNEFLHDCLGVEGLKRAIVVVATSDESSIRRLMAAKAATTIAEHFRSQGKRVLLLLDSLTRTARAMRELGLAAGELPVRQGYTPSVYTELPKLLERAGNDARGSITAIYTVLINSEREADPLAEEIKSILDGHMVLSPSVAQAGIRPAIDLTSSVSRVLSKVCSADKLSVIGTIVRALSRLKNDRDVVLLGGSPDAELKVALQMESELKTLLTQDPSTQPDYSSYSAKLNSWAERFLKNSSSSI